MNPPPGCPFQTRCGWKSEVPGGKCETEVPPVRTLAGGHQIKCHLSDAELATMEPVIMMTIFISSICCTVIYASRLLTFLMMISRVCTMANPEKIAPATK